MGKNKNRSGKRNTLRIVNQIKAYTKNLPQGQDFKNGIWQLSLTGLLHDQPDLHNAKSARIILQTLIEQGHHLLSEASEIYDEHHLLIMLDERDWTKSLFLFAKETVDFDAVLNPINPSLQRTPLDESKQPPFGLTTPQAWTVRGMHDQIEGEVNPHRVWFLGYWN